MKCRVLKRCVVPSADGKSAMSHRQYGAIIDVPRQADAERLVRNGFLEYVNEPKVDVPKAESPKADEPKPEGKGGK